MMKNTKTVQLPDDIIYYYILIRLPAKNLVRFRPVCKSWKYNLSTSDFIKAHLTRQQSCKDQDLLIGQKKLSSHMHGVIVISRSKEIYGPAGPSHSDILLGSINGLVCMASGLHFCVWNPATGQIKEIHFPNHFSKKCKHLLGFSWDHVLDDYKVMIMCYVSKDSSRRLYIYSCKSACWTQLIIPEYNAVPDRIVFETRLDIPPSTIVQGLPYWSDSSYVFLRTKGNIARISVFKFVAENNELRLLPNLDLDYDNEEFINLVNIKDCLVGMVYGKVYKRGRPHSFVDMYSLDEETDSGVWSKMYTLGHIDLRNQECRLSQCFKNGGEILIVNKGSLSFYDPKTKETKYVRSSYYVFRGCYSYTPSLVCVQGMESMVVLSFQEMKLKKLAKRYKTLIRSYGPSSSTSSSSSDSDSSTSSESDSDEETD